MIVVAGLAASANAQIFNPANTTITDGDAVFTLGNNTGGTTGNGPASTFSVTGPGGVSNSAAAWWWVRVGGQGREDAVYRPTAVVSNPAANELRIVYNYTSFQLTLRFTVSGFEYGFGALTQTATVRNTSGGALDFNLFNYMDVNAGGTLNNAGVITGPNTAEFSDAFTTATYEASNALRIDTTNNVRGLLTNNVVDNLGGGVINSLGDLEVAAQFAFSLPNNGVQTVSTTLTVIPTPGAAALLGVGGLVAFRRRRA
jgi:hypothetical protein